MYISRTISLAYGRGLISEPTPLRIPTDPLDAMAFAVRADREADTMLLEGRFERAEKLSHLALEARCRATGDRA